MEARCRTSAPDAFIRPSSRVAARHAPPPGHRAVPRPRSAIHRRCPCTGADGQGSRPVLGRCRSPKPRPIECRVGVEELPVGLSDPAQMVIARLPVVAKRLRRAAVRQCPWPGRVALPWPGGLTSRCCSRGVLACAIRWRPLGELRRYRVVAAAPLHAALLPLGYPSGLEDCDLGVGENHVRGSDHLHVRGMAMRDWRDMTQPDGGFHHKRTTGLEPATSSLGSSRSTR
jgi:hypothetical protein